MDMLTVEERKITFSNHCLANLEYNDEKLSINLIYLADSLLYQKIFTKEDIDEHLQGIVSLEEIYCAIKSSFTNEVLEDSPFRCLFLAQWSTQTETEEKESTLIFKGGRIQVALIFQSKYSKRSKFIKIQLKLKQGKTLSQLDMFKVEWKIQSKRINSIAAHRNKLLEKQNEICNRRIKELESLINSQINARIILEKKVQRFQQLLRSKLSYGESLHRTQPFPFLLNNSAEPWDLVVFPSPAGNKLRIGEHQYRCSVGKNGVTPFKKEGDGKTPMGTFPLRQIWVRQDKVPPESFKTILQIGFNVSIITPFDGWCDDPGHEQYNKHVDLRYFDKRVSHENLWRQDNLYDFILVVGYNDQPPIPDRGSAIFFHISRENYSGTAGCIAVSPSDLWEIIKYLRPYSKITIFEEEKKK